MTLLSFDIDGTLEVGDPPGIISVALVRRAKDLGYLVGSCSDRPLSFQQAMWRRLDVLADFTVLKHRLADLRSRFDATRYYHVGDTDIDEHFATLAGFQFLRADAVAHRTWGPALFGDGRPGDDTSGVSGLRSRAAAGPACRAAHRRGGSCRRRPG